MGDAVASVCCHHFGISSGICCLIAWGVGAGWQPPLPLILASIYKSVLSAKILAAYLFQRARLIKKPCFSGSFSVQPACGFRRVGAGWLETRRSWGHLSRSNKRLRFMQPSLWEMQRWALPVGPRNPPLAKTTLLRDRRRFAALTQSLRSRSI